MKHSIMPELYLPKGSYSWLRGFRQVLPLLLVCLSALGLRAQRLDSLLTRVTTHHPELRALYLEYEAALERAPQVSTLPDPEVMAGVFVLPVETRLGPQWVRLGATQMFPWKGTLPTRKDAVLAMSRARYEQWRARQLQLTYELKKAWYELYRLRKSQHIIREQIDLLHALERLASTMVESGKATMADVLRVQLRIEELEEQVARFEALEAGPLARINELSVRPLDAPVSLPDTLPMAALPWQRDTIEAHIRAGHPLVRMYAALQDEARKQLELNELARKPSLAVGLDYIMLGKRSDADPAGNGRDVLSPRLGLKVPIYTRKFDAREREEQLRIRALEANKDAAVLRFTATIARAWAQWDEARTTLEAANAQADVLRATRNILEVRYATSGREFDELLRIETQLIQLELKRLQAVVQSHQARSLIEQIVIF